MAAVVAILVCGAGVLAVGIAAWPFLERQTHALPSVMERDLACFRTYGAAGRVLKRGIVILCLLVAAGLIFLAYLAIAQPTLSELQQLLVSS